MHVDLDVQRGSNRFGEAGAFTCSGSTLLMCLPAEGLGMGASSTAQTTLPPPAQFRPFEIERPDRTRERFDSIIFANIDQMAKVATLSDDDGRLDDGAFEVITMRHSARWKLLGAALRACTRGLAAAQHNRVRLHHDQGDADSDRR
jgi:diacylglycerol kinase (ATP)